MKRADGPPGKGKLWAQEEERAARYDAMEQHLKALTLMMRTVAQTRGDPDEKGGFDADKAVVAQLATPVIARELVKKMPLPPTEPARLLAPVWKSTSESRAPDNSSLSHVSATTRPCWLRRAVRNRHRHAIEQASRRWRGGRREDSARTP